NDWLCCLLGLRFTAPAAESLRSRWGSLRRAPECSSQGSAVAAPQVGQGTDKISCRVSSLVFIATEYTTFHSQKSSIKLIFQQIIEGPTSLPCGSPFSSCVQK